MSPQHREGALGEGKSHVIVILEPTRTGCVALRQWQGLGEVAVTGG
jgi:hypothetical protein